MGFWIGVIAVVIVGAAAFLAYQARQRAKSRNASRLKLDLAIVQLSVEIRRNPNNAAAFCKRGIVRQRKGDLTGALADLDRALAINPSLTEARYHHASALDQKGDLAAAEKEFDWIVKQSDDPYYGTAAKDRLDLVRAKMKSG